MSAFVDRTGNRYGRLTVVRLHGVINHRAHWHCRCDCGNECITMGQSLSHGNTRSCGCLFLEVAAAKGREHRTHGATGTRTHRIWTGIKKRCFNVNDHAYPRYGGRGITICPRWRDSFENFLADMGECPPGLTIERKKNEIGYEPGNCKWATYAEQNLNKCNSRRAEHDGELLPLIEVQRRTGIKYGTLYYRHVLHAGQTIAKRAMAKEQTLLWDDAE